MDIQSPQWQRLQQLADAPLAPMQALFDVDPTRAQRYSLDACGIYLDYSKNRLTDEIRQALLAVAEHAGVAEQREKMFAGHSINGTEGRAVLHTALRNFSDTQVMVHGNDVMPDIRATQARIQQLVARLHKGELTGYTGKPLTQVVSIGIGGSFLGPKIMTEALKPYWQRGVKVHFVANVDGCHIQDVLNSVDHEQTLVLMSSKSFTTQETLQNTLTAKAWFLDQGGNQQAIARHFMAVTSNIAAATEFGMAEDNLFPMWDWVGGRYSLWSAIGLPIAMAVGYDHYEALLRGAYAMDCHFKTAPFEQNMPVIMAMLGVWYRNFFAAQSHVLLPYYHYLRGFPAYVQQLDMESNGKATNQQGEPLAHDTGPVIWGSEGTNGQHSFHQLLHQGTSMIPADFMLPLRVSHQNDTHHSMLASNCFAQSQALMQGKSVAEAKQELANKGLSEEEIAQLAEHKSMPGNRPSNTLLFERLDPHTLGALVALYEHKVFVQGVVWDVNSFDQWGVELGKVLGNSILDAIEGRSEPGFDASTASLVQKFSASLK